MNIIDLDLQDGMGRLTVVVDDLYAELRLRKFFSDADKTAAALDALTTPIAPRIYMAGMNR